MDTQEAVDRYTGKREALEVDKLFRACVKLEGSDLHLKVGQPRIGTSIAFLCQSTLRLICIEFRAVTRVCKGRPSV